MTPHPVDLDALQKLLDMGTKGQWAIFDCGNQGPDPFPGIDAGDPENDGATIVMWGDETDEDAGVRGRTPEEALANARLIVAAVNALPALLAEVRAARQADWRAWLENAANALKDASAALFGAGYKKASSDAYGAGLVALARSRPDAALASPSVPLPQVNVLIGQSWRCFCGLYSLPNAQTVIAPGTCDWNQHSAVGCAPPVLEEKAQEAGEETAALKGVFPPRSLDSGPAATPGSPRQGEQVAADAAREADDANPTRADQRERELVGSAAVPRQRCPVCLREKAVEGPAHSEACPGLWPASAEGCERCALLERTQEGKCARGVPGVDAYNEGSMECYRRGYERLRGAPPSAPPLPKEEVAPVFGRCVQHADLHPETPDCDNWSPDTSTPMIEPVAPILPLEEQGSVTAPPITWCLCGGVQLFDAEESTPFDGVRHSRTGCTVTRPLPEEQLPKEGSAAAPAPGDADRAEARDFLEKLNYSSIPVAFVTDEFARVRSEERRALAALVEKRFPNSAVSEWIRARASDATSAGGGE